MVFFATRTCTSLFVPLCVAVAANADQPMQGNVNDTTPSVITSVTDSAVARDAISALRFELQSVSEMRLAEHVIYQKRYEREMQLSDSLLEDVKRSKNLSLTSSLQGIVDEAAMGLEEAIRLEQAAQRQYEKTMKTINSHIQGLGEIAAGDVEQATSTLPTMSKHRPKSMAGFQDSSLTLVRGDRVKLLVAQPTWNPPLTIGAEGTVIARLVFQTMSQTNRSFVRVKFDQGITGGLLSEDLQKIQATREVMV